MSEAERPAPSERGTAPGRVSELKVTGHLMTLETGLFCIVQAPVRGASASGLPGIRISLPPGPVARPDAVTITSFRPDGWLSGGGDAALVRVLGGPAQVLVTVYQAPNAQEAPPSMQVLRLLEGVTTSAAVQAAPQPHPPAQAAVAGYVPAPEARAAGPAVMEVLAHVQGRGDMGVMIGDWIGDRGSKRWIEGFGIAPSDASGIAATDIEYQAVLGRGWLSPWVEGGQFCGSRGMALPLLGLRLRLRGATAEAFEASYSATFVDGTQVGPVADGEACEAESLAAIEAFQVVIRPRAADAPVRGDDAADDAAPVSARRPGVAPRMPAQPKVKTPVRAPVGGRRS